jgi:hypothetical protein
MSGDIKYILAKNKAISVIKSCETYEHYDAALTYISLYLILFDDNEGYEELIKLLQIQNLSFISHGK